MNINAKKLCSWMTVASVMVVLSACGGNSGSSDSADSTGSADSTPQVDSNLVANDFTFPEIAEANGVVDIEAPTGPLPTFPARRTLTAGSGSAVGFGDPVVVRYSMYSWSTGELVESTDSFDEPVTLRAGVNEGVPEYLSNSLLGRNVGDRLQLIFETGMEDLPSYLDDSDAYVLVVDLI